MSRWKSNKLASRILIAIVGVAVLLLLVIIGKEGYFAAFFIICAMALYEFYTMVLPKKERWMPILGLIIGLLLYSMAFLEQSNHFSVKIYFFTLPLIFILMLIKLYDKSDEHPFQTMAFITMGWIFIVLPFALLHSLVYNEQGEYSYIIVIGLMCLVWATDTGGYFIGIRFGKNKIFPRVSPKKSWEGFIGGGVFNLIVAMIFAVNTDILTVTQWILMSVVVLVFGTFGDLVESMLKRSLNTKDSSNMLKGHGGFLDRFDAFIFSIPFLWLMLEIFKFCA